MIIVKFTADKNLFFITESESESESEFLLV